MGFMDAINRAKNKAAELRASMAERQRLKAGIQREREAASLADLRKRRMAAEGDARLVKIRQKEELRLAKAQAVVKGPAVARAEGRPYLGPVEQTGLFGAHRDSPFTLGGQSGAPMPGRKGSKKGRSPPGPGGFQGTNPYNLY